MNTNHVIIKSAVNFFFTRVCNYECNFCFHTKKSTFQLPIERQIELLQILWNSGAEKINFAGGEPFLYPETLGELVKHSKKMGYSSVSIISNGSKVKRDWMEKYGIGLDILGISSN